ncbi:MAG TPA: hypothetical protein VGQ08_18590 [Nitrospiraceae bacterium]|nr:hypothetical protein [Nitrospiraceae bacterium]
MERPPPPWRADDEWFKEPELRLMLMISRDTFRRWRKRGLPCLGAGRLKTVSLADLAGLAHGA